MAGPQRGRRPCSTGSDERSLGCGARVVGVSCMISMTSARPAGIGACMRPGRTGTCPSNGWGSASSAGLVASTAWRMSWVAASGWDANETWEAATSTIVSFARSAMNRWSAGGIALSWCRANTSTAACSTPAGPPAWRRRTAAAPRPSPRPSRGRHRRRRRRGTPRGRNRSVPRCRRGRCMARAGSRVLRGCLRTAPGASRPCPAGPGRRPTAGGMTCRG
jgi:hypothetical protein